MSKDLSRDRRRSGRYRIGVALGYVALLLVASVIPSSGGGGSGIPSRIQNFLHIPAFAVLGILMMLVFKGLHFAGLKRLGLAAMSSLAVGFLSEYIQGFIPGRYSSFGDLRLDFIGTTLGIILFYLLENTGHGIIKGIAGKGGTSERSPVKRKDGSSGK